MATIGLKFWLATDSTAQVRLVPKRTTTVRGSGANRTLRVQLVSDPKMLRVDQITGDCVEQLRFPGSPANANCALRTLRRMLHIAEGWKVISHAPKIKMMKEHGRHVPLDDVQKLACPLTVQ
jgi:hypothetical protein